MRQPRVDKEIKRAIGNGRLMSEPVRGKPFQHVIGPQRPMGFQQDFQGPSPHRCQAQSRADRNLFRPGKHIGAAGGMIMRRKGQRRGLLVGVGSNFISGRRWFFRHCTTRYVILSHTLTIPSPADKEIPVPLPKFPNTTLLPSALLILLSSPAMAEPPRIVTDIAPIQALVAEVTGDLAAPSVLMTTDTDPHTFQLRPSQARILAAADVMIWVGPALTPWLSESLHNMAPDARSLSLMALNDMPLILHDGVAETDTHRALFDPAPVYPHMLTEHDADEHAEHGHEEHADHDAHAHEEHEDADASDHDGHDHGPLDPHIWLDPANAAFIVAAVAGTLSDMDPDNAATYADNAAKAIARLQVLDTDLRTRLAPVKDMLLITRHDAFGYFFTRYGLENTDSIADSEATAPGVARLRAIQDKVNAAPRGCLLAESGHSTDLLQGLQTGADFANATLDPLGRDLDSGAGFYVSLLSAMGDAVAGCGEP